MTSTQSSDECKQLHVAVFPWLAFGHILPFLELSKFIAQKGHKVSFLSTTRNIQRLPSRLPPHINLVKLTLPHVQELPENAESTMDVRTIDVHYLKRAFDGLQPEVTRFLEEESPDWIIYDFAPYWLPSVAAGLGISAAFFSILTAWLIASLGQSSDRMINGLDIRKTIEDFLTPRKWIPFPSKVCYRKHEADWLMTNFSVKASDEVSDTYRLGMVLKGSDCMFIRHCYEFEPQWLSLLEKLHQLPVVPLGLMPPETPAIVGDNTWVTIKKWLDGQEKGQAVYVALGSEFMVTNTQLVELALGLELSGLPFFWALRKPTAGSTNQDSIELPVGFLERTRDRGVVWTSWVPQIQILSHESVCGFLTHCGWSLIVEGLMSGHPLTMLPISGEQALNSRVLEDKQVGIVIPRNEEDGFFTKESVAASLRSVRVNGERKIYKANAVELRQKFGDTKLQKKYIDDFIDYLEKKRRVMA
ncbi:UDP-glycosyltransferase 91D2-like [Bidens hawaiensis]|uniref:UDP-glycosyltransferase 91D2-like n=1 Tax=Bidens hawaiensis TaxID=980011 RepID=UPI004048F91D